MKNPIHTNRDYRKWAMLFVFPLYLISCEKVSEKRIYEEVVIAPAGEGSSPATAVTNPHETIADVPIQNVTLESTNQIQLKWTVPKGWLEKPGSGMRLATFTNTDDAQPIECSIVSLGGQAGGLESNVKRWANQISLSLFSDQELKEFISKQEEFTTKKGLTAKLIDFTTLQSDPGESSMMAAIMEIADATVFVKMTGKKSALEKNRISFKSLCQSLESRT